MRVEVERIAALHAQELPIETGAIAVIRAHDLAIADTECRFASVGTMGANGPYMFHLPRPRLIPVSAARQRADRTDIDTGATLIALKMVTFVGNNFSRSSAVPDTERIDT